jgi:hypothetical protein
MLDLLSLAATEALGCDRHHELARGQIDPGAPLPPC